MQFSWSGKGIVERPQAILVRSFAIAILVGSFLLMLPASSRSGHWTDPLTALFISTSAVCVTGLSVVDIGTHFSHFGHVVIVGLVQFGGLGIMTVGTFLLILVGRRLGTQDEFVLMDSLGSRRVHGLISLLRRALLFTFMLEALGALIISMRLIMHGYSLRHALFSGCFHSINAFCNAGFSIYQDNLGQFSTDAVVVMTMALLIILGGLGFLVLYDASGLRPWRQDRQKRGRLSLHSRLVFRVTGILLLVGTVAFAMLEWRHTLAPLDWFHKIVVAFFHSVTPRTAGFNVVDMSQVVPASLFLTMVLMFIGGSPGSTAGGVKTVSIAVLFLVMRAMVQGKEEIEVRNRSVPLHAVREALTIFLLGLLVVLFFFGALLLTEAPPLMAKGVGASDELLFEVISAFGTVGLSTGITPHLSWMGKLCIVACMFVGRLGPLTLALVIGRRQVRQVIRYPEEEIVVG